jgi:hypothetical protein
MVSVLVLKSVGRGFIGDVMVSVLVSKAVDRGFIGGVMVSVLVSKVVDETRMLTITPPMNPQSTTFEKRTQPFSHR